MFRLFLSILLMISFALPVHAFSSADGQFIFRYKSGLGEKIQPPEDDWTSKTVHARFIGGVDILFSEILPLKPEWEDDSWQVDSGTLPDGITFNRTTRTFEGRPEAVQNGINVILFGYDTNGMKVAKADVTFDIRELPANSVKVDLYAHTGKFFNNTIELPQGFTITRWDETELPPGGVDYNGRYVEGTPVAAGQWPILNLGYEYGNDTPIFAYYGTITVEDGPQFPIIADQLKTVGGQYLVAGWDEWKVPSILRAVGDPSKVRYYVERAPGETMPGTVRATGTEFQRTISGRVKNYYEQAKIRIKAIDSDAAEGFSNWFQIGSLGPQGVCVPSEYPTIRLNGIVDKSFYNKGYPIRTGNDASKKTFSVLTGKLPANLTLDKDTGLITGVPPAQEQQLGVTIGINFPDNPLAQQVVCGPYDITIAPSEIMLEATGNLSDYRVGSSLSIQITPAGGLLTPYKVEMDANANLPDTVSYDAATGVLSGAVNTAGYYNAGFTLTNGNGVTQGVSVSFEVHDPLKIDPIQTEYSIARLDSKVLFEFTYDTKAIIGSATWDIVGGNLPDGIRLSSGMLAVTGGTLSPESKYGPYKLRLTDSTGSSTSTDEFWITVTPREPLKKYPTLPPAFGVNTMGNRQPFSVEQAPLAKSRYSLNYELNGPNDLPGGLYFDENTGLISGIPNVKEVVDGFTVKITEQSPEMLSAESDTFAVTVNDPPPIGDLTSDYKLYGNKEGVWIQSRDLTTFLKDVQGRIVGGLQSVKFQSYSPAIPGVTLNQSLGILEGIPTAEHTGLVKVDFVDGANRPGSISFQATIYPYPELTTAGKYDLPRLADASAYKIEFTPNTGFYKAITWALAPTSDLLPNGLRFVDGKIIGSTDAPVGTIRNIDVVATSTANDIKVNKRLTIEVSERIPAKLEFPTTKFKVYLDEETGSVVKRDNLTSSAYFSGSAVKPIAYAFAPNAVPNWLSIDPTTGFISGNPPTLGEWLIPVIATDGEGIQTHGSASLRATLWGSPSMTPAIQSITVRANETFKTAEKTVTNVIKPFTWKPGNTMPGTFIIDPTTGEVEGVYDQGGVETFTMNIEDAHERKFGNPYTYRFDVKRPLVLPAPKQTVEGRQYSALNPLTVVFEKPTYAIDVIQYTVVGDIPGTPYVKTIMSPSGLARYTKYDNLGQASGVVDQIAGETTAETEYRLEPDHLIFDSETLVFSGIPSKSGTFNMTLQAWDTHGNKYYNPSDATRVQYNSAERAFSVSVLPALDLTVENNANTENLHQYTSQPTIRSTVSNDAYGRGVTWEKLSGTLPTNVNPVRGATTLSYAGYPQAQGAFGNNTWKAVDVAGRSINTDAVSFNVGPRQTLELVSSKATPVQMVVFEDDAGTKVTAKNAAYGPNIGITNWVLTGQERLPPGVTAKISGDGVSFSGTSDKIGAYTGIQIRGTDPLGATATYDLTFQVVSSPFPIVLNVYNVKTRIGYPIVMEPPFANNVLSTSNTYGKLRFYSEDLPQDIMLDNDTGLIAGVVDVAQKLNFDLYVTDDTQRVTSEAVEIDVMPNLRVLVPTEIRAEPGTVIKQLVATDYVMGKVQYSKGAGNWPANFEVDPDEGFIYSKSSGGRVTANIGNYSGLTIVATDTFISPTFGTLVDTQTSNSFSINIATAGSYLELKPTTLPDAERRIAVYSFDFMPHLFKQNVDDSEIAWTLVTGSTYNWKTPTGITMKANGVISGTPTTEGVYTFGVRATKKNQPAITTTVPYTLEVKLPDIKLELDDHVFADVKRDDVFDFDMKSLISDRKNIELADIRFTKTTAPGSSATSGVNMNILGQFSGAWTYLGTYEFDVEAKFTSGNESTSSTKRYRISVKGNDYKFKQISAGGYHTCGIDPNSELFCWGAGSRLGIADALSRKLPAKVSIGTVKQVSVGNNHACAVKSDGDVVCWGIGTYGQLGNGSTDTTLIPSRVSISGNVSQLVAGYYHTCAVVDETDLYCWGYNNYGQLGTGDRETRSTPVLVANEPGGFISLALGNHNTCYVRANGTARCVGSNSYGNLGDNKTTAAFTWIDMTVMSNIKKIEMDGTTTCALTNGNSVQCIGHSGDNYKLGNNSSAMSKLPKSPTGLENDVSDMWFGGSTGCARKITGETLCWGMGDDGKTGDGASSDNRRPDLVATQHVYKSISVGGAHVCALLESGSVECWGFNGSGQLGNGTSYNKNVPTLVE